MRKRFDHKVPLRGIGSAVLGIVAICLFAGANASAAEPIDAAQATPDEANGVLWYDVQLLGIEGKGWADTKARFDRLPAKAEKTVRDAVWNLSRHSSGMAVRFRTDATTIKARWTLTSERLEMPHMPATGVSGVDLYVKTDDGKLRWLSCGRPAGKTTTATLASGIPAGTRDYVLYLPLYNGVESIELGIPKENQLFKADPRSEGYDKPIVFYGTSITHGACASRPGMTHVAILGRRLNRPVVNLGFSGNGRMEIEVAELMAELDAAVYVIDCLPNIGATEVTARTEPLVRLLREKRPDTPILLVEDRSYADAFLVTAKRRRNETSREALRKVWEKLQADGFEGLAYLPGADLLGDDGEATVDSSHPTDLGFMRQADAFEEALRPLLGERQER